MTSLHTEHADEGQQHCYCMADCFFLWELMGEMGEMGAMGSDGIATWMNAFFFGNYGRDGSQLEEMENTEERVMRRACFGERR